MEKIKVEKGIQNRISNTNYDSTRIREQWNVVIKQVRKSRKNVCFTYSSSAMKFGSSPRHRYSSHVEDVPQSFLSLKISSVKVDPEAPMKTLDIAHIVLSSIASTYTFAKKNKITGL